MSEYSYPEFYARKNYVAPSFCEIAIDAYYDAKCLYIEMKNSNFDLAVESEHDYCTRVDEKAMIVVTFSAMCVEAFLNDYVAAVLGDNEFYDNFDRLSPISKFQLASRFLLKTEIKKGAAGYGLFKTLFKHRDSLVHSKSKTMRGYTKDEFALWEERKERGGDFLYDSSDLQADVDESLRNMLDALRAIKYITEFFDQYDKNVLAVKKVFSCYSYDAAHKVKQHRKAVLDELGINGDA